MKPNCWIFVFLISSYAGSPTDTVLIKNTREYHPGKVNILQTPGGKPIHVKLVDRTLHWRVPEENELVAPGLRGSRKKLSSTIDPNLSGEQKNRIKENECITDKFSGLSRSRVKTSITHNSWHIYPSLPKFLQTLFPDADMKAVVQTLSKPYAHRAVQEEKMVTIKNVFLLAYAREKDNDYHLIITDQTRHYFFNAELSGLPDYKASSYQKLKLIRTAFESYPGAVKCGTYLIFETPLKISSLTGCLFFDTDHPAGQVGPSGARPATAWEIHPVVDIVW